MRDGKPLCSQAARCFGADVPPWLGGKTEQLPAFKDPLRPAQKGGVLTLDELWSFVLSKAQTLWLWVALCRRTRQIVAWTLGDRSLQSAADRRAALPKGYRGRATRSAYWNALRRGIPGKHAGETCHVERWLGALRQRAGRLARRTLSFSKCAENHLDPIHFSTASYNLAIKQSTLL